MEMEVEDMNDKLKACPFCKKLPEITKHAKEELWSLLHRCKVVGAIKIDWGSYDRIVAAWNTRTPDPLVEELEEVLGKYFDVGRMMVEDHEKWSTGIVGCTSSKMMRDLIEITPNILSRLEDNDLDRTPDPLVAEAIKILKKLSDIDEKSCYSDEFVAELDDVMVEVRETISRLEARKETI